MTLSSVLARFVHELRTEDLPPAVAEKAKNCLLNGYGIALGCHDTPYAPVARKAALAMDGERPDGATLLGDGRKTTVSGAALANSALFHGRAQEDTCGAAHLGAILLPLLTALVEARGVPVSRLLPCMVAGYEVGGLLENTYAGATTPVGFRASPLYGTIAAAAAAGKALGLTVEQLQAALANAASFAGGILQSFGDGTDEWRYQVGVAGRLGLVAAELARAGSVSAPNAFEGKAGFVRAYARADVDLKALSSRLGSDWSIYRVTFKPHPVCAFNQTPVTAALKIREAVGGRRIASVRVRMNPYETGYAGMDSMGPFNSISGTLMSIPFCIASTLLRGVPTMKSMTTYDDAGVNELVARTTLVPDDGVAKLCCIIDVELADGTRLAEDTRMTTKDYDFDRAAVNALVRRIGDETGIPQKAYDHLNAFVEALPGADLRLLLRAFAMIPVRAPRRADRSGTTAGVRS